MMKNGTANFFLNYKTMDRDNENSILDRVAADLALNREGMECHYITSRVQEKIFCQPWREQSL